MAQRQHFECCPHFGDLLDLTQIEGGDAHAAARLTDRQPLRLETAEGLSHRNMAGLEFLGDMVLAKPGSGLDHTGDDAIRQHFAASFFLARVREVPAAAALFVRHRAWVRWTVPVWLYVAVTGWIIYVVLERFGAVKG